jgi:hypothetical protein
MVPVVGKNILNDLNSKKSPPLITPTKSFEDEHLARMIEKIRFCPFSCTYQHSTGAC